MVTIYQDYDDEPEDVFRPLPEELAATFYALEMDNFQEDIEFFEQRLPERGMILELGCGSGRIADKISKKKGVDRTVVAVDISLPMLRLATENKRSVRTSISAHTPSYLCMDMLQLGFNCQFEVILIAYNTLNLLESKNKILKCLQGCRELIKPDGRILLQLFIPSTDFIKQQKSFQFQMFDRPEGGKIIKEIIKKYYPETKTVHVEERFRVRPMQAGLINEDWNQMFTIAGLSVDQWFRLFHKAGFRQQHVYGDYMGNDYDCHPSSTLLVSLTL